MRIRKLRTCSVHISPWVELPLWPRLVKSFRAPWIPSCSVASTVNYWFSHWSFLRGHKCLELNWLLSCDNTGTEVRDVENEVVSRILLDLYRGRVLLVEGRQETAGHGEVVGGHLAGLGLRGGGGGGEDLTHWGRALGRARAAANTVTGDLGQVRIFRHHSGIN